VLYCSIGAVGWSFLACEYRDSVITGGGGRLGLSHLLALYYFAMKREDKMGVFGDRWAGWWWNDLSFIA